MNDLLKQILSNQIIIMKEMTLPTSQRNFIKIGSALKQSENVVLDDVSKCYTEKDIDNAYDKGFNDGNKSDFTGSLIEVL